MIEYVKGRVASLDPTEAVIETPMGVAFALSITLNTYTALQGKADACLLVHENIREDAWTLYGFASARERELFRLLIGVSGVGASTARLILSGLTTAEFESAVTTGDMRTIKNVKGIGAKTAERIIVDLRDKIKPSADTLITSTSMRSDVYDEAMAALRMLGFTPQPVQKVLKKIMEADPTATVEKVIKQALSLLR